ncbi:MAG: uncharacterized protein QOE03_3240 [Micromonosporaceae bacterium]|jgi:uncharacterized protein YqeY|nr:uncharacterized protein [Micromonosporaceae bacterium]
MVATVSTGSATDQPDPALPLRQRLGDALRVAMKARDRVAVSALRSALAAMDNAEAVDRTAAIDEPLGIEQIPVGVGAAEVERRVLTPAQLEHIVRAEVTDREAAAREYDLAGRPERAERLRGEVGVLSAYLPDPT